MQVSSSVDGVSFNPVKYPSNIEVAHPVSSFDQDILFRTAQVLLLFANINLPC